MDAIERKLKFVGIIYAALMIIFCFILLVVYFEVKQSPNTFSTGKQTFLPATQQKSTYMLLENLLFGTVYKTLSVLQKNILQNITFRTLVILIAVLATLLMGISMLTGDQKLTIKDMGTDIFIIFGTATLLLSPQAFFYLDFLYNIITSFAKWIINVTMTALYNVTSMEYAKDRNGPTNIYRALDIVASIFFDPVVSARVRIKMTALMFTHAIFILPILIIIMVLLLFLTLEIFVNLLVAKFSILLALQVLPFFIMFSAVNDVKVKLTRKSQSRSHLMTLIDVGIVKPWIYLALMGFITLLLFDTMVLRFLRDIFNFAVYVPGNTLFTNSGLWKELGLNNVIHDSIPTPMGIQINDIFIKVIFLVCGMALFKTVFAAASKLIQTITFDSGIGSHMASTPFSTDRIKDGIEDLVTTSNPEGEEEKQGEEKQGEEKQGEDKQGEDKQGGGKQGEAKKEPLQKNKAGDATDGQYLQ
ncbi:MAG: hypothetical protein ACI9CD_000286 [Candidatus Deianiraeaceae bacterium]|jgi:hypothetical protein